MELLAIIRLIKSNHWLLQPASSWPTRSIAWSPDPEVMAHRTMFVFWFVLHRKTHCSFFNLSHYSYSHSSCQVRLLVKPPKKAHLTTNHRRISADTSKQGNTSTVSTTWCAFQWHAIQNGLAINYLEAGENIKGNSLARNKTINGISKWKHLKVDKFWHSVSCQ